mgnify:FL=1
MWAGWTTDSARLPQWCWEQEGSELNDMAKNLILWLIIAAVLVTVMNNFSSTKEPDTLNYSQFLDLVENRQVERVTVDGKMRRIEC